MNDVQGKRDAAMRKIAKLLNCTVANGCTPAEAADAAGLAQKLLEKYQLDILDIETGAPKEEVLRHFIVTEKRVVNPGQCSLVAAIAGAFSCKVVIHQDNPIRYALVGFDSDCQVAIAIYNRVYWALHTRATLEAQEHGEEKAGIVRFRNCFLQGAAAEIARRLRANRAVGLPSSLLIGTTGGTALVLAKEKPVQEQYDKFYPKGQTKNRPSSRSGYNHAGHEAGKRAGRDIGLHVQAGGRSPQIPKKLF